MGKKPLDPVEPADSPVDIDTPGGWNGVPVSRRFRAVWVSPHFDDAVFSSGGRLARLAGEGSVAVVNVFMKYSHAFSQGAVIVGPQRAREEAAAAARLGFESVDFGEKDSLFRNPAYASPGRVMTEFVASDMDYLPRLEKRLTNTLSAMDFQELYLPLGVGWHVDHRLTFLASRPFWRDPRTFFFEEIPYSFLPHLVEYRLREIGRPEGFPPAGPLPRDIWDLSRALIHAGPLLAIRPPLRWGVWPVAAAFMARRLTASRSRWLKKGPILTSVWEDISKTFISKREACYLYDSQAVQFLGPPDTFTAHHHAHGFSQGRGKGYFERYWRMVP